MKITVSKINKMLFFKLPSAYWCGVRLRGLSDQKATVTVTLNWMNKNPFKSMYFAVQSMAAELSTGAIVIKKIQESGQRISMLVTHHSGSFTKKAVGKITFTCNDGTVIDNALQEAITTKKGQTFTMKSKGVDEKGNVVSNYEFQWSIKVKE